MDANRPSGCGKENCFYRDDGEGEGSGEGGEGEPATGNSDVTGSRELKVVKVEIVEEIESGEETHCTGYDKDARAMMVPMQGSNKIKVKIHGPSYDLSSIKFVANTPNLLTISPVTPTSTDQVLTLSGTAHAVGVKIQLQAGGTYFNMFEADVLKRLNKTIEIHAITEGTQKLAPTNVPSAAVLQAYLNTKTWGNQANVFFTVTRSDHTVNYDLDRNGALKYPKIGDDEVKVIFYSIKSSASYRIFYVKELESVIGTTYPGSGPTFTDANGENSPENHTSHEIGHALGIGYHSDDERELMFTEGISSNPCRISRKDWRVVNP